MTARDLASASDRDLLGAVRGMFDAADPAPPIAAGALSYDWRALTVRQPWCDAILLDDEDPKRVEIRTRRTTRRGPVLLHAGAIFDHRAVDRLYVRRWMERVRYGCGPLGVVTGVAVISGCHESAGCCGEWGDPGLGPWHWVLGRVWRLPEPVPCKGALGFWRPSPNVLAAVLAQIGEAP